ncbi:zinc/manganese transport system substrate-binding protein [Okibacterium sp. HSC-33S16]|uniref:metal ABC transporter solute-binding protein, Zn/Mn family n=1 Tax=Okibacterium sp. HSC-33S16 TaxID=2910965 RepID=UPI00209E7C68|nr:zinc ABC transporter substrate-binding protein [Okibacterium sp. HSC-33S16]MCP2031281.1 zinc/manganese transport system substrate-binding protein [Okibacterium sp. HSC-33S16]
MSFLVNTRLRASLLVLPATAFLLSGCSAPASEPTESTSGIRVVSSTNVYGSIASIIGGEHVDVTSIIDSAAQDPHSYEASAQDQLAISKADVVIENGGGYDPFLDTLLDAAGSDDVELVNVVDLSGLAPVQDGPAEEHAHTDGDGHEHIEGFNEHVWYDLTTADTLASTLAHTFSHLDEDNAASYSENYSAFSEGLAKLMASTEQLKANVDGTGVALTEPVPQYLLEASGLRNLTPADFSEAIEEGADVSPASMRDTLALFATGEVALLAYNEQTSSPETERVRDAADENSVPVVSFAETLPDGEDYVSWMTKNIAAITDALSS